MANISDPARVSRLGLRIYRKYDGATAPEDEEGVKAAIDAYAQLLHRALANMDEATLIEVRENLLLRGPYLGPGLWENPAFAVEAHSLIEASIHAGRRPTLLELLLLAHDLESFIRPNLLRLLWIAQRCNPSCNIGYGESRLNPEGEQGSVGYAIRNLRKWIESTDSRVLGEKARDALDTLVASFKSEDSDHVALEDMRNWVAHRDFRLEEKHVVLELHPAPGRRLSVSRREITLMRRQLLSLVSEMKAFQAMFYLHNATAPKSRAGRT